MKDQIEKKKILKQSKKHIGIVYDLATGRFLRCLIHKHILRINIFSGELSET